MELCVHRRPVNVHKGFTHHNQELETTQRAINWWAGLFNCVKLFLLPQLMVCCWHLGMLPNVLCTGKPPTTKNSAASDVHNIKVQKYCHRAHLRVNKKHKIPTRNNIRFFFVTLDWGWIPWMRPSNEWTWLGQESGFLRDFPGSPVVKTPSFHCRGHGFRGR